MLDMVVDRRETEGPVIARAALHGAAHARRPGPTAVPAAPALARDRPRPGSSPPRTSRPALDLASSGSSSALDNIRAICAALGHPERAFRTVHRRRHQRQGLGRRDGRGGAARRGPPHRPLHLAAPGAARGALRDRRRPVAPEAISTRRRRAVRGRRRAPAARGDARRPSHLLRGHDRRGLRAVPRAPASRSRSSKSASAAGSTRPTSPIPMAVCHHVDRLRPRAVPRATRSRDRVREGGHHQAGRPGRRGSAAARGARRDAGGRARARRAARRARGGRRGRVRPTRRGPDRASRCDTPARDYGAADARARRRPPGEQRRRRRPPARGSSTRRACASAANAIVAGLATVRWPGRLERVRAPGGRDVLLDAARTTRRAPRARRVPAEDSAGPRPLVFGGMRDKDVGGMLRGARGPRVSTSS